VTAMDFDQTIQKYHRALSEFHKGRPELILDVFSQRDDVSLTNPLGPTVRGRKSVRRHADTIVSNRPVEALIQK